jgi:hypothetical protein
MAAMSGTESPRRLPDIGHPGALEFLGNLGTWARGEIRPARMVKKIAFKISGKREGVIFGSPLHINLYAGKRPFLRFPFSPPPGVPGGGECRHGGGRDSNSAFSPYKFFNWLRPVSGAACGKLVSLQFRRISVAGLTDIS